MKTERQIFLTVLTIFFLYPLVTADPVQAQSSHSIKIDGRVIDKSTAEPLPGVNVYLLRTTIGTSTDKNGYYEFSTTLTGQHELVFSFVGYETKVKAITLDKSREKLSYNIKLIPKAIELEQVEVTASNAEWQRQFREFKEQFLGTTFYAVETEIENPWVLDFDRDERGHLVAISSQPLQVTNNALGYRLRIDLGEFSWESGNAVVSYKTQIKFEKMESGNQAESKRWERNRERAYRGSFWHFLYSLYHNRLKRNRFEIVVPNTFNHINIHTLTEGELRLWQLENGVIPSGTGNRIKGFRLPGTVDVLFGSRRPASRHALDNRLRSRLVPLFNDRTFIVTSDGRLWNHKAIRVEGGWGFERIANTVPLDYPVE